ncbi:MAG: Uma2 family endonuclease [Armatimonadota bacterium]
MNAVPDRCLSLDDYFLLEETSEIKYEYYQGAAYAMTGASEAHNLIVANVISLLHPQLRGKSCRVYPSDFRLKVQSTGLYTYPDVMVICGPTRNAERRNDTATNPSVLIEVLSPSTEDYDRGKKFQHYRTVETLREYIVISQDSPRVEQYIRQDENRWLLQEFKQIDNIVTLTSIDCSLSLTAVYENVSFDENGE